MKSATCPKSLKILLVGEGGQGIQTIAKILAKSAYENGYHSAYIPNFGTEQRGGISLAYVQISCDFIIAPKFKTANIFLILSSRDIERSLIYIGPETNVIYDKDLINSKVEIKLKARSKLLVPVEAFKTAISKLTERSFNIIILGILTGLTDQTLKDKVTENMDSKFSKYYEKNPELKELNHKALEIGLSLTR